MRTFSCFVYERSDATPTVSFIFAADLDRARDLARRELVDAGEPSAFEICENGKLLWTEPA